MASTTTVQSNTTFIPPGAEKFIAPPPPVFPVGEAVLSAVSLLVFTGISLYALTTLRDAAWWKQAPFAFTALGSGLGFLYEAYLLAQGRPYQLFGSKAGRRIQQLRAGILAFVCGASYLAFSLATFSDPVGALWLIGASGVLTGSLAALFLFEGPPYAGFVVLTAGLAGQIAVAVFSSTLANDPTSRVWFLFAAATLYASIFVGAETPRRSTAFHVLGSATALSLWLGLRSHEVLAIAAPVAARAVLPWLLLAAAFLLGVAATFRLVPKTWGPPRTALANFLWPLFYLVIAGGMRIPRPERLSELYRGRTQQLKPLTLFPYYIAHPRALSHAISVPALDDALTVKVQSLGFLAMLVKTVFAAASLLNRFFPFANIDIRLADKPRMDPLSDGSDYWPRWLRRRFYIPTLGWFSIESGVRGPGQQPAPQMAVDAYQRGQLLAYMVEFGIAGSFVRAQRRDDGAPILVLDFTFLEKYETKPDYEPYGGTAYFSIDERTHSIRLDAVRAPRTTEIIPVDPQSAQFRHAEDMVLASVYFYVVSGKHLVEIHMGLNLVEVALFNSFDAAQSWNHPVRLALYPHLFAHELAEELTTQNLLEDRAIFPQIFATTNASLMRHLNDRFAEYALARDEDFDDREQQLLHGRPGKKLEELLPNSSLHWERRYFEIWLRYATALMDAAYVDDASVQADAHVQLFFANLSKSFQQPLPARYRRFETKAGLARFIADTMHHLIIRHEVYGTTGVRLALDPRINKVQVPKDGRTYAIDEWRALACVAMATSRVRYVLLSVNFTNVFEDLDYRSMYHAYVAAHDQMKDELRRLEKEFDPQDDRNYQISRLLPSDLEIGAGY